MNVAHQSVLPGGFRLGPFIRGYGCYEIYEATHPTWGAVEVKLLHSDEALEQRRFQREVATLRALPINPFRPRYLGHGALPWGAFLARERVPGLTLAQVLAAGRSFDEEVALTVVRQLCQALSDLHRLGAAHCAVLPSNIVLARQPTGGAPVRTVLVEMDRVRDAQGLLQLYEHEGMIDSRAFQTPPESLLDPDAAEFIAPEQLWDAVRSDDGALTDTPADVFALGALLYGLLIGRAPWPYEGPRDRGTHSQGALKAYLRERSGRRYELSRPPSIGDALWTILERALRRDSRQRQVDARELLADLTAYSERGAGVAPRPRALEAMTLYVPDPVLEDPEPPATAFGNLGASLETGFVVGDAETTQPDLRHWSSSALQVWSRDRARLAGQELPDPGLITPRTRRALWMAGGFAAGLALYALIPMLA